MIFKKLTETVKTKYTEADFAWDEKAMVAEYKAAVLDYMNGASMEEALKAIKAMLKAGGDTIVTGKGRVRESTTTKITKSELKEMIREVLREELANNDEMDKEISSRSYSEKDKHLAKNLAADNEISNKNYSNHNKLREAASLTFTIDEFSRVLNDFSGGSIELGTTYDESSATEFYWYAGINFDGTSVWVDGKCNNIVNNILWFFKSWII